MWARARTGWTVVKVCNLRDHQVLLLVVGGGGTAHGTNAVQNFPPGTFLCSVVRPLPRPVSHAFFVFFFVFGFALRVPLGNLRYNNDPVMSSIFPSASNHHFSSHPTRNRRAGSGWMLAQRKGAKGTSPFLPIWPLLALYESVKQRERERESEDESGPGDAEVRVYFSRRACVVPFGEEDGGSTMIDDGRNHAVAHRHTDTHTHPCMRGPCRLDDWLAGYRYVLLPPTRACDEILDRGRTGRAKRETLGTERNNTGFWRTVRLV